jgi:hypothetical protein
MIDLANRYWQVEIDEKIRKNQHLFIVWNYLSLT